MPTSPREISIEIGRRHDRMGPFDPPVPQTERSSPIHKTSDRFNLETERCGEYIVPADTAQEILKVRCELVAAT